MKYKIYRLVVDVWRLAAKYEFQNMGDSEWEAFVAGADGLLKRYRDDAVTERLCRNLLDAFQEFYKWIGK